MALRGSSTSLVSKSFDDYCIWPPNQARRCSVCCGTSAGVTPGPGDPRQTPQHPIEVTYPTMPCPDTLLQISDSSYRARAEDGLSVKGLVSLRVCSSSLVSGRKDISCPLIDFASKAQRHVTRSTFSSERFAATDAVDIGLAHTIILHEFRCGIVTPSLARQLIGGTAISAISLDLVVGAKSVSAPTCGMA